MLHKSWLMKNKLGLLMFNPLTRLMPKKDFPNNFDKYRKIPADKFKTLEFEEFMDWKVAGWELPGSVACIIRVDNSRTNKVQEFVYRRIGDAVKRTQKLMEDEDNTITVCNPDEITSISCRAWQDLIDELTEESDED